MSQSTDSHDVDKHVSLLSFQVYWLGPCLGACIAGFCYEFVFATNASVNKGVCYLQKSHYDPDKSSYFLPLIREKCRCQVKCVGECERIQAYENFIREKNSEQNLKQEKDYRLFLASNSAQHFTEENDEASHDSRRYFSSAMYGPRRSLIGEDSSYPETQLREYGHMGIERRPSEWESVMTSSSLGNTYSSIGENISLDPSICEERVSVL